MALPDAAVGSVVANIVLPLVALVGVALRFLVRVRKHQPLQSDDWTILGALICCIAVASSAVWASFAGVNGVPWNELSPKKYVAYRKVFFTDILILHFIYGIVKVSVILFYKRIFAVGRFIVAANIALALSVCYIIASFFTVLFCSRGVSTFWTTPPKLAGTTNVIDMSKVITAFAVLDILLDVGILAMPLPVILRLHMSRQKRLAIAGVFFLGAFCLVCSGVRLYYARQLFGYLGFDMKERIRLAELNNLWAHIEAHASTITACLPTLRPLFKDGRGVQSLLGSVRSFLSNRSQSAVDVTEIKTVQPQAPSKASSESEKDWYASQSKGASTKIEALPSIHAAPERTMKNDKILLKTTFGSEQA